MLSATQPTSSSRVVTRNLLISASHSETNNEVQESSIHDLSTLINVIALYDELFVLNTAPATDTYGDSDLIRLLSDEQIVKTQELDEKTREEISQRAKKHLAIYLSNDNDKTQKLEPLLRSSLSPVANLPAYYAYMGGVSRHMRMIDRWLRTIPDSLDARTLITREEEKYAYGETFLLRAFLYMAYAHLLEIPFTPDHARSAIIKRILNEEDTFFRTRILNSLQENFEKYPPPSGDGDYRQMISPFAAVVFQRCNGSRSRLVTEIKKIRDEMRPTRERLRELEWHALWDNRAEAIKAESKLRKVLDEIAQNFGPQPGLLNWETGISLGKETGEIVDNPTSWKAWLEGLLHLPVEVATRLIHRRPVAEIHRLQNELPGSRGLNKVLFELFGDLKK